MTFACNMSDEAKKFVASGNNIINMQVPSKVIGNCKTALERVESLSLLGVTIPITLDAV